MESSSALASSERSASWRAQAARTLEELFPVTATAHWDLLLDLRGQFLHGTDWNQALDLFLTCREQLETDHYLPFYRLRRLLSASLQLEAVGAGFSHAPSLQDLFQLNPRSLADARRVLQRELFEQQLAPAGKASAQLRVVERI